jgi:predicted NBD/HSP70 family sugar kinase
MTFLGIDVGGTTAKAAAMRDGQVLWTARSAAYRRPDTRQLIEALRDAVAGRGAECDAVGLCVPGVLSDDRRQITYSVNVPGLHDILLSDLIAAALDRPAPRLTIVNDAGATAHDLYTSRGLSGRLLTIVIGTGVGASVLDDGKPLLVDGGTPGHLGQIDVSLEGEDVVAPDGGRGGLEGYLSAGAIARRFGLGTTAERLRPGDVPVRALIRLVRITHAIYRPHHVCLAGGIGIRLRHLVPEMRNAIATELTSVARPDWTLSTGDSDYHAATGAAKLAARAE